MGRQLAAWFGTALMLGSSWSFAAGGVVDPAPSGASAAASSASASSASHSAPAASSAAPAGTAETSVGNFPTYGYSNSNSLLGSLPDLSGPAYGMIPRSDESAIGHMIVKQVRDANLLLEDPEITDYLQTLGMRLASQAHDEQQNFDYHAMRDPEINAFAQLGGQVFIFSGLILATEDEAQLASVMAHETGHVVQRHMERAIQAQSRISLASTAAMLAGILIGAAASRGNSGEGIQGAIAMGQALAMQQAINYTRSQEIEADYVGIQLLAGAGYDPYQMAAFFQEVSRSYGMQESEIPALLLDHPVTSERIAAARARAAEFPRPQTTAESTSYSFIKERVRVLAAAPDARIEQYYAGIAHRRALTPAERYGQALVQVQSSGTAATAIPTLRELQQQYPTLVLLYSALGQALAAAGQQTESLALFANAEQLFPRNVPLTIHYGETLLRGGQPKEAHQLLLDLFNNAEPTPAQIWLTAQAASAADDAGDAYYYMCEYNLENGDLALANQELELALATPKLSNIQRERFRARLLEVRDWMREQQSRRGG
jgi:predicted Zn-dependent protease